MVTRIQRSLSDKPNHKVAYLIFDEAFDFGCIILDTSGKVSYHHFEEDKGIEMDEVEIIDEFMKKLHRIENDEELNTLQETYFYAANRPEQTEIPDKTS